MKLVNIDRLNSTALGGMPSEHDFCIVYGDELVRNPLTGEEQRAPVFSGTLKEAREFITAATSTH